MKEVSKEMAHEIITWHFLNEDEFNLTYPIPSVAKSETSFHPYESKFLWRGPTWAVVNWFLYQSLIANGFETEAHALLHSLKQLIEKSGFREYYNPTTGKGYGAKDFTWSGLIMDMIKDQKERK